MSHGTFSAGTGPAEEEDGDDFLGSRLPRDVTGSSLVTLLGQKTVVDINRELTQLETNFDRERARYQRQRDMLLLLRKALAKRDGVSLADAPKQAVNGRKQPDDDCKKTANASAIYGYLRAHPGSSPADIVNATGLARGTVNSLLMSKKGKFFRSQAFGKWEVIPTDERKQ